VREIADATSRDVRFLPLPIEEFTSALAEQQLPPDAVALIEYLFTEVLDGRNESLTDGVQRALRRQPRDFREYARDTAATGVWNG
jgi:hypothetical protein